MEKLRVWHMPQVPGKPFCVPVNTPEEGKKVMDILAAYDLFQHIKPAFANMNGLQRYDEQEKEWLDWDIETEDDYFDNVDDYLSDNEEINKFTKQLFSQLKGVRQMYGYISGFSDTDDIHYCPYCGEENLTYHADGTATCDECGKRFGVIECDEDLEDEVRWR